MARGGTVPGPTTTTTTTAGTTEVRSHSLPLSLPSPLASLTSSSSHRNRPPPLALPSPTSLFDDPPRLLADSVPSPSPPTRLALALSVPLALALAAARTSRPPPRRQRGGCGGLQGQRARGPDRRRCGAGRRGGHCAHDGLRRVWHDPGALVVPFPLQLVRYVPEGRLSRPRELTRTSSMYAGPAARRQGVGRLEEAEARVPPGASASSLPLLGSAVKLTLLFLARST